MEFPLRQKFIRFTYSYVGLLVVLLFLPFNGRAQEVNIDLEPGEISIGQHARLSIEVEFQGKSLVILPVFNDTITSEIEVLSYGRPDTLHHDQNRLALRQEHIITAWDEGFFPIPPMEIITIAHEDTLIFETEPLLLEVSGIEVDMAEAPKDIKPIFSMPITFRELLPYVLGALALAALIWLLVRYVRRPRALEQKPGIWEKPDIPAHIAAISSLESLRNKKLWQKGKVKLYHSELTDILRMYLEKRFRINALEMTSGEILNHMQQKFGNNEKPDQLGQILKLSDLVKFAKYQPEASQNENALELAIQFVKETIPKETTEEKTNRKEDGILDKQKSEIIINPKNANK